MEDFRYVNVWRNGFNEEHSCGRRNTVVEDFRCVNVWRKMDLREQKKLGREGGLYSTYLVA